MNSNGRLGFFGYGRSRVGTGAPDGISIFGNLIIGFLGSLCCGGGLVFGTIGLGAFWGALGLWRYIPEALATGAILITLTTWLYYRRKAARMLAAGCDCGDVRRAALVSGFLGLAMMAASFVFLEWLNHGVVHAAHFTRLPEFASAVIPGVPNSHLAYVASTFLALPVLVILPFPRGTQNGDPRA